MTKEDYQKLKLKEGLIEHLLKYKKTVEQGKIMSIQIRVFDKGKIEYEDVQLTDIPTRKIKHLLLENLEVQLTNAKAEWDDIFNNESIFLYHERMDSENR